MELNIISFLMCIVIIYIVLCIYDDNCIYRNRNVNETFDAKSLLGMVSKIKTTSEDDSISKRPKHIGVACKDTSECIKGDVCTNGKCAKDKKN